MTTRERYFETRGLLLGALCGVFATMVAGAVCVLMGVL